MRLDGRAGQYVIAAIWGLPGLTSTTARTAARQALRWTANCACGPVKPASPSMSCAIPRAPCFQAKTLLLGSVSHLTAIS